MMLPVKLWRLPRNQKFRKLIRIFAAAERGGGVPPSGLAEAVEHLLLDPDFSGEQHAALEEARAVFAACGSTDAPAPEKAAERLRAVNTVRHILVSETGRSPADWDFIDHTGKLDSTRRRRFSGMTLYLEDIRSPFNVGAIFRSAESFGVERIILSPLCADPRHRRAERAAMGCVDAVPWERSALPPGSPEKRAMPLFALETGGTPLGGFSFPARGIMLLGSEELGLSPQALSAAARSLGRVSIPVRGAKGSLNVSVAAGIALHAWAAALAEAEEPDPAPDPFAWPQEEI